MDYKLLLNIFAIGGCAYVGYRVGRNEGIQQLAARLHYLIRTTASLVSEKIPTNTISDMKNRVAGLQIYLSDKAQHPNDAVTCLQDSAAELNDSLERRLLEK